MFDKYITKRQLSKLLEKSFGNKIILENYKGSGGFGSCYATSCGRIVKAYVSNDRGYESFVDAVASKGWRNAPRITHHLKGREFNIVIMEKLEPQYEYGKKPTSEEDLKELPVEEKFKQVLFNVGKRRKLYWDLHVGNIMVRPSTGEFIVTDPYVG